MRTAIVVTGMGAHCAAGGSVDELWAAAVAVRCRAERTAAGIPVYRAAELPANESPHLRRADRSVHLAIAAARSAALQARLSEIRPERLAVVVGTSRGPLHIWDESARRDRAGERQHPSLMVNGTLASLGGALSVAFCARAGALTVSATCASAAHAIAAAADQIRAGHADAVLAGGADAPLQPALLEQFRAAGLLGSHPPSHDPARACRPFDISRNGTVLGEGAGMLILESAESARRRGVEPLATLSGWATTSDAGERVDIAADAEGLRRAVLLACERATIDPASIDYVNAHGTGTVRNDVAESRALASALRAGSPLPPIPCSSTKPVTGHCAGATPAIEAILAILAMRQSFIPPTATCEAPDPDCPIDPVPGRGRAAQLDRVLSTSLGIWGNNAALIFDRAP